MLQVFNGRQAMAMPRFAGRGRRPWFLHPQFEGMAEIGDYNRRRYARTIVPLADIPTASVSDLLQLKEISEEEHFSAYLASGAESRTYWDEGTLKNDLLANVPRFDWSNGKRQLLLENQATNLVDYSGKLGTTGGWNFIGTINSENVTLPNGVRGTSFAEIAQYAQVYDATNGAFIGSTLNYTSDGTVRRFTHTVTVPATCSLLRLYPMRRAGGQYTWKNFPVTTGATYTFSFYHCLVDGVQHVGGVQLNEGSFATSLIETNGVAVTRPVETFRLSPLIEAILQRSEGGVVVRGQDVQRISGRIVGMVTPSYFILTGGITGAQVVSYNGTNSLLALPGDYWAKSVFGAAMAFDETGRVLTANGLTPVSDSFPTGARTSIYLGRDSGSGAYADGRYDFLGILASRPSNERLQQLAVPAE